MDKLLKQAEDFAHEGFIAAGYPDISVPILWSNTRILACAKTTTITDEFFDDARDKNPTLRKTTQEVHIEIHAVAWPLLTDEQRRNVMFHEVAHIIHRLEGYEGYDHTKSFWEVLQRMRPRKHLFDQETLERIKPHVDMSKDGHATVIETIVEILK